MNIADLLDFAVKNKASDLHLSAGQPPMLRIQGEIRRLDLEPLTHKEVHQAVYDIMTERQRQKLEETMEVDFSFDLPNVSRFRVNAFMQMRGMSSVFRAIPANVWSLEDIGTPTVLNDLIQEPRGLILVTGPTGSGKSTTLAAMIDAINNTQPLHVLTLEDPIEFIHNPKRALINQRELEAHTLSFAAALRASLREDPDVILVGEMRDLETIRLALTAAETGHLVLSTLHTASAPKTISRIVDVFPGEEQAVIRTMLSESLKGAVSQALLKRKDGSGMVAAFEMLVGTAAVKNLVRENKLAQIYSAMQTGQASGMQTLDQHMAELVKKGVIESSDARAKAVNRASFGG